MGSNVMGESGACFAGLLGNQNGVYQRSRADFIFNAYTRMDAVIHGLATLPKGTTLKAAGLGKTAPEERPDLNKGQEAVSVPASDSM